MRPQVPRLDHDRERAEHTVRRLEELGVVAWD
jgi:hypothetical protein